LRVRPKLRSALEKGLENEEEARDEVQPDLTLGTLEKTNDPVRVYLREMGAVPLLNRDGEVDTAKRIERGQLQVLKALSRSPVVIHQILAIREDLKHGVGSIRDIVAFDEGEVTGTIFQNRIKDLTRRIDEMRKHYRRARQLPNGCRPSPHGGKDTNTVTADGGWAARLFGFRSSSGTSVLRIASANA
jgi:RNA polymerase primary sigma factor